MLLIQSVGTMQSSSVKAMISPVVRPIPLLYARDSPGSSLWM
jgi:hypothetical protein